MGGVEQESQRPETTSHLKSERSIIDLFTVYYSVMASLIDPYGSFVKIEIQSID